MAAKKRSGTSPLVDRQRVSQKNAGHRKNLSKGALKAAGQARGRAKKYGVIVGGSTVTEQRTIANDFRVSVSTPVKTKDGRRAIINESKLARPSSPDVNRKTSVSYLSPKVKKSAGAKKK